MADADSSTRLIDISTKKYKGRYAIVDADMYEFLSQWKWGCLHQGRLEYAVRRPSNAEAAESGRNGQVRMHRVIFGRDATNVDHKDGNTLNNTRANLRDSTKAENGRNRPGHGASGYKGVYLDRESGKYYAQIKVDRKTRCLGRFHTPHEAHAAYCEAAKKYHGEFANTRHRSETADKEPVLLAP